VSEEGASAGIRTRARTLARLAATFVVLFLLTGVGALLVTGMLVGEPAADRAGPLLSDARTEPGLMRLPLFLSLGSLAAALVCGMGALLSARTAERLRTSEMEARLEGWQTQPPAGRDPTTKE
jgi:hypothetical protein